MVASPVKRPSEQAAVIASSSSFSWVFDAIEARAVTASWYTAIGTHCFGSGEV